MSQASNRLSTTEDNPTVGKKLPSKSVSILLHFGKEYILKSKNIVYTF